MNAHTNKRDEIYTHRFERMSFTLIKRRNYNKKKRGNISNIEKWTYV